MTWWVRVRLLVPSLAALVALWGMAPALEGTQVLLPNAAGEGRALVPLAAVTAMVAASVPAYGLDRHRSESELPSARPLPLWDASWLCLFVLLGVGAAVVLAETVPEGGMLARNVAAGLGLYLLARLGLRPELALLVPLGSVLFSALFWRRDAELLAGWLASAETPPQAGALTGVLLVAGVLALRPGDRRQARVTA